MQDGPNGFEARWSESEREQFKRELHGFAHGDTNGDTSGQTEVHKTTNRPLPEWAGANRHERRKAAKQARRHVA